jgi:hypothetical protein
MQAPAFRARVDLPALALAAVLAGRRPGASGAAAPGDLRPGHPPRLRHRHAGRDRPRQPGPVRRRPQEGRVRDLRGRREAGDHLVRADARRPHLQPDRCRPPRRRRKGIILPPARPTSDAAGRIFIIFVDDLHLDFRNTGRIRDLFKRISKELIHEGDMFGIVSTGPSSLAIDLTYDRKRLEQAIRRSAAAGCGRRRSSTGARGRRGRRRSATGRTWRSARRTT